MITIINLELILKLSYSFLKPNFFCARPELVEGFPRALEEILQQVQDERENKIKELERYLNFQINSYYEKKACHDKHAFFFYLTTKLIKRSFTKTTLTISLPSSHCPIACCANGSTTV